MKWHLLTMDFYLGEFDSYAQAKQNAQSRICTKSDRALRPKRSAAGFYEIDRTYYVCTGKAAVEQGFELERMKQEAEAEPAYINEQLLRKRREE